MLKGVSYLEDSIHKFQSSESLVKLIIYFLQCKVSAMKSRFCFLLERMSDGRRKCLCVFCLASLGCLESLSTALETPFRAGSLLFSNNTVERKGKVILFLEIKKG